MFFSSGLENEKPMSTTNNNICFIIMFVVVCLVLVVSIIKILEIFFIYNKIITIYGGVILCRK